mgnify:FL=1
MYDGYERWNIKGAVDHKISDKISAGFSTNMATASKESGSNYSILEGFRMTPNMPCYYWEGEKAGQLISQPGKDTAIYPNGGGPTSSINPVVDRLNSKDDTRSYDVMANIYLQYSPVKEIILKTTFSPMYTKTHRVHSITEKPNFVLEKQTWPKTIMMKYSRILGIRKPITSRILEIIV